MPKTDIESDLDDIFGNSETEKKEEKKEPVKDPEPASSSEKTPDNVDPKDPKEATKSQVDGSNVQDTKKEDVPDVPKSKDAEKKKVEVKKVDPKPEKKESPPEKKKDSDDPLDDIFGDSKTPEKKVVEPEPKKVEKTSIDTDPVPTTPSYTDDSEFDTSPDKESEKAVILFFARKGEGKTYGAFSIPGTISCISFDRKSQRIAALPEFSNRVTVYDGLRYYDKTDSDMWLETSTKSWKYITKILDRIEKSDKPDWVCIDGGEIVHVMFEMVMRDRNDLRPFQGIANKNLWKYRNMLISQLLSRCEEISKYGVLWTAYVKKDEIMKDGDYVVVQDIPKWIGAVLYETDSVVRMGRSDSKNGVRFFATVQTSKWKHLKNSPKIDITDSGMEKLLSKEFLKEFNITVGEN